MNIESSAYLMGAEGAIEGDQVIHSTKTIGQLAHIFLDEHSRALMNQNQIVYQVQAIMPVPAGTNGGLFWGTTSIEAGCVNNEYFMTQGHFHQLPDRAEYYWGIEGVGVLLLMNRDRTYRAESMHAGSLHYIPAHTAHRVANIGESRLSFGACWPSDAGHDYDEIIKNGFACRLIKQNGKPSLIPNPIL